MSVNDPREPVSGFSVPHACPVGGCPRRVPNHQLMCARHWKLVSPNLQRQLYAAWDRGRGAGSDEHTEAMRLCIEDAEHKLVRP